MLRKSILAIVVIAGFGLATLIATGQFQLNTTRTEVDSAISIQLPSRVIELGNVLSGERKTINVTLLNHTGENQQIIGARTSCGCL